LVTLILSTQTNFHYGTLLATKENTNSIPFPTLCLSNLQETDLRMNTMSNSSANYQTNGTAQASVTGGTGPYTYQWSTGQTGVNVSLPGGIHQVTVTDNVGNQRVGTVHVFDDSICPPDYLASGNGALTGIENGVADYETDGKIESTQVINTSAQVDYDSKISIELQPGFEVKGGAIFNAFIDGCNNGAGGVNLREGEEDRNGSKSDQSQQAWEMSNNELHNKEQVIIENSYLKVFPNPFLGSTNVKYNLPEKGLVKISVFDNTGREVAVLENNVLKEQGEYIQQFDASKLSKGIYLIRLVSDYYNATRKMIIAE